MLFLYKTLNAGLTDQITISCAVRQLLRGAPDAWDSTRYVWTFAMPWPHCQRLTWMLILVILKWVSADTDTSVGLTLIDVQEGTKNVPLAAVSWKGCQIFHVATPLRWWNLYWWLQYNVLAECAILKDFWKSVSVWQSVKSTVAPFWLKVANGSVCAPACIVVIHVWLRSVLVPCHTCDFVARQSRTLRLWRSVIRIAGSYVCLSQVWHGT